jgi:Zn-finger nucleic acid-binding protein
MKNEKDRAGDKFDDRANEDSYFAAKEHELIEDMKTEFRKDEADRREARMASCPKCSGKLEKYRFMEFVLERCESCEGIWLEKGEIEAILRRAARGPLGAFLDRSFSKDEPFKK